jgi:hypothetical protein
MFLKLNLKGFHFESLEDIQSSFMTLLEGLLENDFKKWQRHWNACIKSEGKYFEGDHTH